MTVDDLRAALCARPTRDRCSRSSRAAKSIAGCLLPIWTAIQLEQFRIFFPGCQRPNTPQGHLFRSQCRLINGGAVLDPVGMHATLFQVGLHCASNVVLQPCDRSLSPLSTQEEAAWTYHEQQDNHFVARHINLTHPSAHGHATVFPASR